MRKIISWSLLISFSWLILIGNTTRLFAQNVNKKTIAVLTINSRGGVSPSEAQTLTDRLRSELVNTNELSSTLTCLSICTPSSSVKNFLTSDSIIWAFPQNDVRFALLYSWNLLFIKVSLLIYQNPTLDFVHIAFQL